MLATLKKRRARSRCDDTVAVGEIVETLNETLQGWGSRDLWRYIRNAFFIVLLLFVWLRGWLLLRQFALL